MALTDTTTDEAPPRDKPYSLFDGHGLFVLVKPNGGKYWRLQYGKARPWCIFRATKRKA